MVEFRTASKGEKEHPKVIMPEEKDKIVHELLNKEGNGFYFEYKNVPDLNISMVQFEKVMIELEDMGMLKIEGYKNAFTPLTTFLVIFTIALTTILVNTF